MFLDLPDTQARFRVTPWEPGSDNLHQAFRGSSRFWHWLQLRSPRAKKKRRQIFICRL
jgi:hypothetical protein